MNNKIGGNHGTSTTKSTEPYSGGSSPSPYVKISTDHTEGTTDRDGSGSAERLLRWSTELLELEALQTQIMTMILPEAIGVMRRTTKLMLELCRETLEGK